MSIFINSDTKIITQGVTGRIGRIYTQKCIGYGSGRARFVAGVNPKKAGETIFDVPIFGTVAEAKRKTGATASIIYVPPASAAAAIWEAVEAEIDLIVCATDAVPIKDMLELYGRIEDREAGGGKKTLILGPSSPGILIPGELKLGMIPAYDSRKGDVGVITSSGALTYEIVAQLRQEGLGASTIIGLGKGIHGLKNVDVLQAFNADMDTKAVVIVAETGSADIVEAALWYEKHMSKPVVVYMAGVMLSLDRYAKCFKWRDQDVMKNDKEMVRSSGFLVAETLFDIATLVKAHI
ncbi:MAG: succinate--CoA ligase subunit alpha [Saezia sp.]